MVMVSISKVKSVLHLAATEGTKGSVVKLMLFKLEVLMPRENQDKG